MERARRFLAQRGAVVGSLLACALIVLAIIGPALAGDPAHIDIEHGLSDAGAPLGPSGTALLGTDPLGRDVWARIVSGASTSLAIAALATLLALAIGLPIGLVAGYAGGRIDDVLMRFVDLALAFPYLLLAILLAALFRDAELGSSIAPVVIPLALVGWTTIARVVRGAAMQLARSPHVLAAHALGASPLRIVLAHVLRNLGGLVLVLVVLAFAQHLLAEAVLSFLGLGPPPPAPTWGRMVYEGRMYLRTAPWLVIAPGVAIVLAVLAANLVAGALRAAVEEPR